MPVHCLPETAPTPLRLCETCLHAQPIDQFRRRRRDAEQRMRQCRRCHNEFERYRRAAIRARMGKRRIARDLATVRDATSANRVKALCGAMVRGYGGAEGFIDAWLGCLRRDLRSGGLVALRHLEATVRLIQHCETERPDYSRMTDQELELARIAMLKQLQR